MAKDPCPDGVTVLHADCLDAMRDMPDASVEAIVTDPPYGLSREPDMAEVLRHWLAGDDYQHRGSGFAGKAWDSFVPGPSVWRECFRVLKPGGHLLAFAGTRTSDLMGIAIRLGGFERRDTIRVEGTGEWLSGELAWGYATGYPKSLNIAKAIDRAGGVSPAVTARMLRAARERAGLTRQALADAVGCTKKSITDWEDGRLRDLADPSPEFLVPSPAYRRRLADVLGYTEDERTAVGIDRRPIGYGGASGGGVVYQDASTGAAREWVGWGTGLRPAHEPIIVARRPPLGTAAANVLEHRTGGLNVGATTTDSGGWPMNLALVHYQQCSPAGSCHTSCPVAEIDTGRQRPASQLFQSFRFEPKAAEAERPAADGVTHETPKPLALMQWLVRLVTPPGGTVLDPFAGSGTTAEACLVEGFRCVVIEKEAEYLPLIAARLARQCEGGRGAAEPLDLFDLLGDDVIDRLPNGARQ